MSGAAPGGRHFAQTPPGGSKISTGAGASEPHHGQPIRDVSAELGGGEWLRVGDVVAELGITRPAFLEAVDALGLERETMRSHRGLLVRRWLADAVARHLARTADTT